MGPSATHPGTGSHAADPLQGVSRLLFGRVQLGEGLVNLRRSFVTVHGPEMSEPVARPLVVKLALLVSATALALRHEAFAFDSAAHSRSINPSTQERVDPGHGS